jgi:transposase-like protein
MHSYSSKIERLASEFKDEAVQQQHDCGLRQADIADAIETTTQTVSRWMAYSSEFHIPAFALAVLPATFSIPLIRWIAARHGYTVEPRKDVTATAPTKTIANDCLEMHAVIARLYQRFVNPQTTKHQLQRDIGALRIVLEHAQAEIEGRQ